MRKCSFIKRFKAVITCLAAVALMAALLFVTVQPVQAGSFTIPGGETRTNPAQSLDGGEVGLIEEGGTLEVTFHANTGIFMENGNNSMTNNGLILMTGKNCNGIQSSGSNSTITNNGTISATNEESHAIILTNGNDFEITNNGTISMTGPESYGIYSLVDDGNINTINNIGSIKVTGNNSYAIKGGDGDEIVNLLRSSDITGDIDLGAGDDTMNYYLGARVRDVIDLGDDTDTANIFGPNAPHISTTLSFENTESINLHYLVGAVNDGLVVIVDPTGQSVKAPVLNSLCTGLHGIIRKRLNHYKPKLIKLASTRIEPGMLKTPDQPQAWGDTFHSYRKRDNEGRIFAYDHEYNGFTGGFEKTYKRLRAGVMGGYSRANVEADSESFRTDSNTFFTGAYGQYD